MFSATLKPMYTWLSDYVAKLLASGLIKREKKSPAFMYPLNGMKQDCINYQMFIRNICCSQYQFSCLYIA